MVCYGEIAEELGGKMAAKDSFQAGQTAKALKGCRVQSLPVKGHGRQSKSREK
jgi:hypothetical protein